MRNTISLAGAAIALLFSLQIACTSEQLPEPEIPSVCDTEMPTYTTHIKAIVETNCAYSACHDGAGGAPGNFSTFGGMMPYFDDDPNKFNQRVVIGKNMPPSYASGPKSLTQEELDLFNCWIMAGFPE